MLCITRAIVPQNFATPRAGITNSSARSSEVPNATNPTSHHLGTSKHKRKCQFLQNQKKKLFTTTLEQLHHGRRSNRKMDMTVYGTGDEQPGLPFSPLPFELPFDISQQSWQTWVLGAIVAAVTLPLGISTWWMILKSKVDSTMKAAEAVAGTVEKVAEEVEKVAEDIADGLPEGKFREAATFVENIAKEAERDARLVDEAIEMVEEVENKLDKELNSFIQTNPGKTKDAKDKKVA